MHFLFLTPVLESIQFHQQSTEDGGASLFGDPFSSVMIQVWVYGLAHPCDGRRANLVRARLYQQLEGSLCLIFMLRLRIHISGASICNYVFIR